MAIIVLPLAGAAGGAGLAGAAGGAGVTELLAGGLAVGVGAKAAWNAGQSFPADTPGQYSLGLSEGGTEIGNSSANVVNPQAEAAPPAADVQGADVAQPAGSDLEGGESAAAQGADLKGGEEAAAPGQDLKGGEETAAPGNDLVEGGAKKDADASQDAKDSSDAKEKSETEAKEEKKKKKSACKTCSGGKDDTAAKAPPAAAAPAAAGDAAGVAAGAAGAGLADAATGAVAVSQIAGLAGAGAGGASLAVAQAVSAWAAGGLPLLGAGITSAGYLYSDDEQKLVVKEVISPSLLTPARQREIVNLTNKLHDAMPDVVPNVELVAGVIVQPYVDGLEYWELSDDAKGVAKKEMAETIAKGEEVLGGFGAPVPGKNEFIVIDENPANFRFNADGTVRSWFDPLV